MPTTNRIISETQKSNKGELNFHPFRKENIYIVNFVARLCINIELNTWITLQQLSFFKVFIILSTAFQAV